MALVLITTLLLLLLSLSLSTITVVAVQSSNTHMAPPTMASQQGGKAIEKKYRMVALDLDGTLLHSNHRMSDETRDYLQELDRKGFTVVIATGRAAATVYEQVERLNLPHSLPVVCSNGSRGLLCSVVVEDGGTRIESDELFSTPVPEIVSRKTIQLAKEEGYVSQYYVGEHIYADPRKPHHFDLTQLYKDLTGSETIYVEDDFEGAMTIGRSSKQLVFCRMEEQEKMIATFQKELAKEEYLIDGKSATIVRGHLGWFLEILHPNVCKGNGLKNMCFHLNIDISEVIAFGDGDNDYEFIQMAGKGIVMKNGRDIVKGVGDEIIDYTNDEDGVMKTLQRMERDGQLIFANQNA